MVFDAVMLEDQRKIKEYFCRDTHNNVHVFYLCHSIHRISKHRIRQNANMFILFNQDVKTLKKIHEDNCSGDMDFKEFKSFCDKAWMKKYGFVGKNISDDVECGRYWSNYTPVFVPEKYYKKLIYVIQYATNTNYRSK